MKSSEVLKAALERMDGGRKWVRGIELGDRLCSIEAVSAVTKETYTPLRTLKRAVGVEKIVPWNDSASDFSVIEKGFERAISLAIAEGD